MTEQELKGIDSRIDRATEFIAKHFSGLKQQIANQPGGIMAKVESIEKKMDRIIELLSK